VVGALTLEGADGSGGGGGRRVLVELLTRLAGMALYENQINFICGIEFDEINSKSYSGAYFSMSLSNAE